MSKRIGRPKNTRASLWKRVDVRGPDECWLWQGHIHTEGYGRISIDCIGYYTHVIACEESHGPAPDGYKAMHSCNTKLCCNPKHLSWGTVSQNTSDAYKDGLAKSGERHPKSKLTWDDVKEIRASSESQNELARRFGIRQSNVWAIIHHKTWRHEDIA